MKRQPGSREHTVRSNQSLCKPPFLNLKYDQMLRSACSQPHEGKKYSILLFAMTSTIRIFSELGGGQFADDADDSDMDD